jgi:membrane-bound ClpP family serine protease
MNTTAIITYVLYIIISVCLTYWVGRTLYANGRVFIVESFRGNEQMADSVNHLLLVGFYLINFGVVSLFLKFGEKPTGTVEGIEYVATKVGVILIVLGGMHFFNMFNIAKMRKKAKRTERAEATA